MSPEELSYLIRCERKKRGLSQRKMADRIGVSDVTIKQYETDLEGFKTFDTLHRILAALGYELTVVRRHDNPFDR